MSNCSKRFLQGMLISLLPMDGPVLHPDDHHILRYYAAIVHVVRPTMHQVFKLLRPNDTRTVKELIFAIEGYSQTKYKKQFDESERQRLDNNEQSESYDISLLYKLLQLVCNLAKSNDTKWSDPGTLEYFLRQLKNERNVLAHENLHFSFEELQEKVQFLEDVCREALIAAGLRSGQPVDVHIDNMKINMMEALNGGIDLWEPYKAALNDLRSKLTNVLVKVGRDDLKKFAHRLKILNPFAWLLESECPHLDVEHVFTNLTIQGREEIHMQDLLVTEMDSGDLPDVIIISGPPGIGKTSLVRFMVHDWLSFKPTILGLENVDLILPVELRHVSSDNLKDLIKEEMLPSVSNHLQNDDILTTLNNLTVVWLLDGFDEASLKVKKVIKEILKKSHNSRILITTRTEFVHEIEKYASDIHCSLLTVCITGFSSDNIEHYAKKFIEISVKNVDERDGVLKRFMEFCMEENSLQSELFTVPLYLVVTLTIWLDDPLNISGIKTMSALYSVLIDHIVNKLIARDSFCALKERKLTLQKKINSFLDELGFILWKDENEFTLLDNEVNRLERKCKEVGIPFQETMSAFFVCCEKATTSGTTEEYTIIHRTLKEFLSARAFCNYMISEGWDIMRTAGKWIEMTRDTLQYNPNNFSLQSKYNLENLDMEKPEDDYISNTKKKLSFNDEAFYFQRENICSMCLLHTESKSEDEDYYNYSVAPGPGTISIKRAKKYWHHIRMFFHGKFLTYVVGYLCIKNEMNQVRSEQLVFLSHRLIGNVHIDHQLCYLLMKEGVSTYFTSKFSEYLQSILWSFTNTYNDPLYYAKLCLQYVVPNDIHLHFCKSLRTCPRKFINECIQTFKIYRSNIYLDLRSLFMSETLDSNYVNNCIKELLHSDSEARLVMLHSPLNEEGIKLLEKATDLKELSLKISANNLPVAAKVFGKLPSLQTLRISIDPASYCSLDFPPLNIGYANLLDFVIVLPDFYQLEPAVVGELLMKMSPYIKHVILIGLVVNLTRNRLMHYVNSIMANIKYVKEIYIMLDLKGDQGLLYYLSLQSLKPFLRDFYSNINIIISGFTKHSGSVDYRPYV